MTQNEDSPANSEGWTNHALVSSLIAHYKTLSSERLNRLGKQGTLSPEHEVAILFALAEKAYGQKQYTEAIQTFQSLLQQDPTYSPAWVLQGRAFEVKGEIEPALAAAEMALKQQPTYTPAWALKVDCLVKLKQFDRALTTCEIALTVSGVSVPAVLAKRGDVLLAMKQYPEAVLAYQAASEQAPTAPERAQYMRQQGIAWSRHRRIRPALAAMGRGFTLHPSVAGLQGILLVITDCLLGNTVSLYLTSTVVLLVLLLAVFSLTKVVPALALPVNLLLLGVVLYEVVKSIWDNRSQVSFLADVYWRSGPLAYIRAILIFITTMGAIAILGVISPPVLRWGWGQWVFGNSGNAVMQPLIQAEEFAANNPDAVTAPGGLTEVTGGVFDWSLVVIIVFWALMMCSLPFLARYEEQIFRHRVLQWPSILTHSLTFGLVHLVMGIPIFVALGLGVAGFLFACRYKYAYHHSFKHFQQNCDSQSDPHRHRILAETAALKASSTDHAIYNALIISLVCLAFALS